jgi:hypothetical protein
VECTWCREKKAHRCQAQIYVDGEPFCLPCADGDPCVVDRVGAPPVPVTAEVEAGMFEAGLGYAPAPVIHRTPEELGFAVVVEGSVGARFLTDEEFAAEKRKAFDLVRAVARRAAQPKAATPRPRAPKKLPPARVVATAPPKRIGGSLPGRAVTFRPEDLERRSDQVKNERRM